MASFSHRSLRFQPVQAAETLVVTGLQTDDGSRIRLIRLASGWSFAKIDAEIGDFHAADRWNF